MISPVLLWGVGAGSLAMLLAALAIMRQIDRQDRLAARMGGVKVRHASARPTTVGPRSLRQVLVGVVYQLGSWLASGGLLSANTRAGMQATLAAAGLRGAGSLNLFIGSKLLLLVGMPLAAYILLHPVHMRPFFHVVAVAGAAVVGLLAPDYVLRRIQTSYAQKVSAGLPDALDMMVICAEAGLGLERTLERVAEEIGPAHPQVGKELRITVRDMGISADRREALKAMAARAGVEGLARLSGTLVQSIQYGTPLSQALRLLSSEMRQEMLTRFEERAARLPVMLTVPMILFILPCVFIVAGGPAAVSVMKVMAPK